MVAQILISSITDPLQKNDENRTPLDLCEDEEMREIFVKAVSDHSGLSDALPGEPACVEKT